MSIVAENQKQGVPKDVWDAPATGGIEGFAADISYDTGDTVSLKINVNSSQNVPARVEIYRLGYYGGDGATLVTTIDNLSLGPQPDPITDARGVVDAGNWSVSANWQTPEDAVSGVYLAKLIREDNGATNQIPFILREDDLRPDGKKSDIVFQTSDTTWHAYNGWAGNNGQIGGNFYGGFDQPDDLTDDPGIAPDRAFAVSYNRPITTRDGGGAAAGAQDYLFGAEYAAIYWLEKNGYDVSYIAGVDTDRLGVDALLGHKAFLSVGHDEYWSGGQRANVEAARDAGVSLLFWSGNEVYWKTRYEPSIDGANTDYRTLVSYKETWANFSLDAGPEDYANIDPSNEWTGTWRDLRFVDARDEQGNLIAVGARPENSLTGQLFGPDGNNFGGALDVPQSYSNLRVWRDTAVEGQGISDLGEGIIGYEWNTVPEDENRPPSLIKLSETTLDWPVILTDQGNRVEPGTATHNLTLYRAPSGALVFSAGTVFWTWGLSDEHDLSPYFSTTDIESPIIQQLAVNVFADMGIQPGVADAILASQGLVRASASTDFVPATTTLADLPDTVDQFTPVTITGTATDDDGDPATSDGVVGVVEVSVDGGSTWRVANGKANWSYTWVPVQVGTFEVVARAIDDSLNLPQTADLLVEIVDVTQPPPPTEFSLFEPFVPVTGLAQNDGQPLELGVRFLATETGRITELKYWRADADASDTDVRDGHLWDQNGNLLATVTFTSDPNETGWQVATLSTPVQVLANTEYVASYHTDDNYFTDTGFFTSDFTEFFGRLTAPGGANGVYAYNPDVVFPTQTFQSSNYWVDLTFEPGPLVNTPPVFTSPSAFSVQENSIIAATLTAVDGELDPLSFAIVGGIDAARFTVDENTGVLSFVQPPDFEAPADDGGDNIYDLTVSVTDNTAPPVEQSVTVTVTDLPDEGPPPTEFSLFEPFVPVTGLAQNDGQPLELGVRFLATETGRITELKYWRADADASDTDVRDGHLWDQNGNLLATVTFTSDPNETGWQVATLSTPVQVLANTEYVASYHTDDNYFTDTGFFTSDFTEFFGRLTAPGGANGVYAYNPDVVFPTQTFQSSNYWVDLTFEPGPLVNTPPVFTSPSAFSVQENSIIAATLTAVDGELDPLSFAIVGGIDAARFTVDENTGVLSFVQPPDFEAPADDGGDNVYDLTVSVTDSTAPPVEQTITVTVTDIIDETGQAVSTLFEDSVAPTIKTNDPTDYELGVKFQAAQDGNITGLRYYRGVADADDTDSRTLNLWTVDGLNLASATVESVPGESGWQFVELATPVAVQAGQTYVASYGTVQNYAFTSGYFTQPRPGPDGILTALASDTSNGNGVFAVGAPGIFPTQTFQSSNYWVDVAFEATPRPTGFFEQPPLSPTAEFTSSSYLVAQEDTAAIARITAVDPEGDDLTFAIVGGRNARLFEIDEDSGLLSFATQEGGRLPGQVRPGKEFEVTVSATDGGDPSFEQEVTVEVVSADRPGLPVSNDSGVLECSGAAKGRFTSCDEFRVAPDKVEVARATAVDPDRDDFAFNTAGVRNAELLEPDHDTGLLNFGRLPWKAPPSEMPGARYLKAVVSALDDEDPAFLHEIVAEFAGRGRSGPPRFVEPPDPPDFFGVPAIDFDTLIL